MRLIGIDYGLRRTGIAVGETETGLALPFEMFEGLKDGQLAEAVGELVRKEGIEGIVVGMPWNADGTISAQAKLTERFIVALQQVVGVGELGVPIYRVSEHLTTHDSEGKLAGHFTREQKRQRVDAIAAARILQDWLDGQSRP